MTVTVLDDAAIERSVTPERAVAAASEALVAAHRGALRTPARLRAECGATTLVFTAGGTDSLCGFRAYGVWPGESDQLVAVWDADGGLAGIVVGSALGAMRTGALGAVAADALARRDARTVAVVGAGRQAWAAVWALRAVRAIDEVRVASRTAERRDAFVGRTRSEMGIAAVAVTDVSDAVRDADIVVLATRATEPVVAADDIAPGSHVTTVGPKSRGASELPTSLLGRAAIVASDSPIQLAADPDSITAGVDVVHVGAVVAGDAAGRRRDDDITLYCSAGLAGSEVLLARAALAGIGPT